MPQFCLDTLVRTKLARFQECLDLLLREGDGSPGGTEPVLGDGNCGSSISLSVYWEECWTPSHAGKCPSPLDLVVFDGAIRSGARRSIQNLQQALGCEERDGSFGASTQAALESCDAYAVAIKYLELRRAFYQDAVYTTFCKGKDAAAKIAHIDWLLDSIDAIA